MATKSYLTQRERRGERRPQAQRLQVIAERLAEVTHALAGLQAQVAAFSSTPQTRRPIDHLPITVANQPWRVYMVQGPMYHPYNPKRQLVGLADGPSRSIYIASCTRRLGSTETTLYHELRHAWCFTVGRPEGEEDDADHFAAVMKGVRAELDRLGGVECLARLIVHPIELYRQRLDYRTDVKLAAKGGA